MRLSDLIGPRAPAGAALFLNWEGFHVFSVPKRELISPSLQVRLFGIGGKRMTPQESFVDCALREGREEIGAVISHIESAERTYLIRSDGGIEAIDLIDQSVRPQLIWEKHRHSRHGSMAHSNQIYYLVAFRGHLLARPRPLNEIAAIVYLNNNHLALIKQHRQIVLQDLLLAGAKVDCQAGLSLSPSTRFIPHGTVHFLLRNKDSL
ncbi:MAG: hypothetical protein AAF215_19400 [Cyanobacteria bacterium P01_A01_bin.123]